MPSLVGKEVGSTGYGLKSLTFQLQPPPQEQAFAALTAALNNGANFWNGGEFYGTPERNSLHLLNEYFTTNPAAAEKVVLSIKGCLKPGALALDGSEENVRRSVNECLRVLDAKKKIDIFECARVDPNTPIEVTIGALKKLVEEGKISGIGLSEVSSNTIRKAHSVHSIAAVEGELSLWALDNLENGVLSTCAELGIPFVAYSPLGRGVLTGQIKKFEDLNDGFVATLPKYRPGVLEKNLQLVEKLETIVKKKECTLSQLALAWVKHLSGKPGMPIIIPIPGTTTEARVNENCKNVSITDEEAKEIEAILEVHAVRGDSPYCHRVAIALAEKGLPLSVFNEDLTHESQAERLLEANPVHKKAPTLIYNGRFIAESSIIVQYIDDTWPRRNSFFPDTAYGKAQARFWADFIQLKVAGGIHKMLECRESEVNKKAFEESMGLLNSAIIQCAGDEKPFFFGKRLGYVDISFAPFISWISSLDKFANLQIPSSTQAPRFNEWITALTHHPTIKPVLFDPAAIEEKVKYDY